MGRGKVKGKVKFVGTKDETLVSIPIIRDSRTSYGVKVEMKVRVLKPELAAHGFLGNWVIGFFWVFGYRIPMGFWVKWVLWVFAMAIVANRRN